VNGNPINDRRPDQKGSLVSDLDKDVLATLVWIGVISGGIFVLGLRSCESNDYKACLDRGTPAECKDMQP